MINKRTFGFHLTAWLMVCLQLFTPLFFTAASVARAAAVSQPGLPELGMQKQEKTSESGKTTDRVIAAQAARAGQVLSSDDSGLAAQSYAQGLAASAINQEISDWLAQRGTARVSVGSHQKVSGDILYAIYSNNDYLFFAQGGVRAAEDRNTTNFGLGYRQNAGDWLLGINAFYDYDYTGKNARMGIGTEAWTDYLRFAANGYFRITNWHASRIDAMRDYDERPANGFDIRAEGWLPALPQVGGKLKYEQYFGDGVYLGNSSVTTDKLKSDPKALMVGLTWTPVPLVTLTGEQSTGDSHDSRVGLDFTWRFDVPLSQQLSPDAVQTLRSIKASRYELVDRNYDIVMQYRKQTLLSISLPDVVTAESLQTVRIPLTVNKAKYGLKETQWTPSASFTAAGGTFRKVSETLLEVKVPAYTASATTRSTVQEYTFTATGTDSNGNRSNSATTIIRVMPPQLSISALTASPAGDVPADNTQFATLTATVADGTGQPAGAQAVTFTLSGLTGGGGGATGTLFTDGASDSQQLTVITGADGKATVRVRSSVAGTATITATTQGGDSKAVAVTFILATSTAEVTSANLIIAPDGAVANGTATNGVTAIVTDGAGNPVPGISVSLGVSSGAIITPASVTSDANGKITATVTSTTAGTYTVSAQAAGSSTVATKTTTFVADVTGATIELVANAPQASYVVGNQVIYTARARDAGGSVITGATFNVSASGSASTQAQITSVSNGVATLYVTDTKSGTVNLTISLQNAGTINASDSVTFIADSSTARVEEGNLVVTSDGALADRVESNTVVATVTDQYGNIVPDFGRIDFNVSPVTGGGSSNISWESTTNSAGQSLMTVTSTSPKDYRVTVNINGVEQNPVKIMNFAAKLNALTVNQNNAPADGVSTNEVRARAVYPTQNTGLAGVAITFRANNGGIISEETVLTSSSGFAITTLTSLTSGTVTVTASIAARTPQELTVDTTFVEP